MDIKEQDVRAIVQRIVSNVLSSADGGSVSSEKPVTAQPAEQAAAGTVQAAAVNGHGLFTEMDDLIAAAGKAHEEILKLSLETRKNIISNIRQTILANNDKLSTMAVEETTFGKIEDKKLKNRLAALKTPGVEDLEPVSYTDDYGLTLVERAPYGVIGCITPCTNPTETLICNGIGMVAGGNAVVFNPHPVAKKTSNFTISLFNKAVEEAGGPSNLLASISNPTIESAQAMMKHPGISLLVVTGGPAVVRVAMQSGKKVIAAGPGNPPVVVDETADIDKAGRDIVSGAGIDNNIICICEKTIVAVHSIVNPLKEAIKRAGGYELNREQTEKITDLVIADPGKPDHEGAPNKKYVGKDAAVIARDIGLTLSSDTKILFCEVGKDHPLVWTEQLMPVIPLVSIDNADAAIDFAKECEHGFRHTASMHSKNIDNLSRMAKVMNCSLFVKNGPNYSGLGFQGAGFTSFTVASPTGEGMTRARTFTRERRCSLIGHFRIV